MTTANSSNSTDPVLSKSISFMIYKRRSKKAVVTENAMQSCLLELFARVVCCRIVRTKVFTHLLQLAVVQLSS